MKKCQIFIFILFSAVVSAQSTKFAVMSDIHFMSSKIAKEGEALSNYEKSTGRNITVLHQVLDKTLQEIIEAKPDVLLITGDLTNLGEKQSHLDIIHKLNKLKRHDIRVMVIPGNHDINIPNAKSYDRDKILPTQSISDKDFVKLYDDFGFKHAISRDKNSLSYLAKIDNSTWIIAFDTNLYKEYTTSSISKGRISSATMKWALDILEDAKNKNITVIGMMHHGLIEHLPYQSVFFSDYLVEDWENNAQILADAGLQVVLTGHFHANDVTLYISPSGNKLYDIETGSLATYPFPYRIIDLNNKTMNIETHFIHSVKSEPNLQEVYRLRYEDIAKSSIASRVKSIGVSFPEIVNDVIVILLTRMSLLHAAGDEKISSDTQRMIEVFARVMGDENFEMSTFSLDYEPADNNLTIDLK